MGESPTGPGVPRGQPFIRKRLVTYQAKLLLIGVVVLPMAALSASGLGWVLELSIFAGAFPLGLIFGFHLGRRLAKKADVSGVYRRRAPSAVLTVVAVVGTIVSIQAGLLVLFHLYYLSLPFSQMAQLTSGFALAAWGLAVASPIGILFFRRRARSRLWVHWFPSPWAPRWIEYRFEYNPPKDVMAPTSS